MGTQRDAVKVLSDDHQRIESLFQRYEGTKDTVERTKIAHEIVHDLAVHGEIEELLFYPRLREALPDGDELAEEAVHEHLEIKHTLNKIDAMTAEDEGFDDLMAELMAEVRHHVEEEEGELFPKIRDALSADDLVSLGSGLEGAKAMVPTRPHPTAPTGPIGKLAASPPVALVDRIRDRVRAWSDKNR